MSDTINLYQIPVKPKHHEDSIIVVMATSKEEAIEKVKRMGGKRLESYCDRIDWEQAMIFGDQPVFCWI